MTGNVTKRKPRLFYLDWVRGLSAILIVITHFNNPYLVEHPIFANSPFGIYIGSLGVSQFLIISGAALMYSHEDAEKLDLKRFYWKRCKSIFPMFWIAFIAANVYLFLRQGGIVAAQAPKYSVLLSVIGMDGYLANAGIPTFYTLGEWFLGFILLFYVIFPLLRYGVKRHPWITGVIIAILYVLTIVLYPDSQGMPSDLLLTTRLPELAFGMYFVRFIKKVPHVVGAAAVVLLAVQQSTDILKGNVAVTLVGVAFFLFLVWISQWVDRQPVRVAIGSLSKYSYAIFLVHHQVIMQVYTIVNPDSLGVSNAYLLFVADMLIIAVLSWMLLRVTDAVVAYVSRMFQKVEK